MLGTKADFYTKDDGVLIWRGSIEWECNEESIPDSVIQSSCNEEFLLNLESLFNSRKEFAKPSINGWPWCWSTSKSTDYAYIMVEERGAVYISKHNSPCYTIYDYRSYKKRARAARMEGKIIEDFRSFVNKTSPFTPSFPKMK